MDIKNLIKFYRKELNLTQKQLAEKMGTTHDTISLWELGKSKPDYNTLQKLCVLFDITGDEILEIETKEERTKIIKNNTFNFTNSNNNNINF